MTKDISVLTNVYIKDRPEYITEAVESVINQTLAPKQVVMVVDGPVTEEIDKVLNELEAKYDIFEVHRLAENVKRGKALAYGTQFCKYDYIAIMDSDDIALPDRFEKIMNEFEKDPTLSIVGGYIQEFFNTMDNPASIREVPEKHEDIVKFLKSRCPFCQVTVIIKKEDLLKAGGYQNSYNTEDYHLWVRMCIAGAKFYNIPKVLSYVRIDYDTFERRGGYKYFKSIKEIFKIMRKNKLIGFFKYRYELLKRFVGHVLTPKKLKNFLYMRLLRRKIKR